VAVVEVPVSAPVPKGRYLLTLDLVQEGVTWFSAQGVAPLSLAIDVNGGYGATYQTPPTAQILIGAASTVAVTVQNTGTRVWSAAGPTPVRLGSHLRDQAGRLLLWDGPRAALPNDVGPGGSAAIVLPLPQPAVTGTDVLELDLVQEGVLWFSSEGVAMKSLVANVGTAYAATYTVAAAPALLPGERLRLAATIVNAGAFTWTSTGANPVRVSSHVFDASGRLVRWDGPRVELTGDVAPGAVTQAALLLDAPLTAGSYVVRVDLVREGQAWFSSQGVAMLDLPLTVAIDRRASISFSASRVSRAAPGVVSVTIRNTSGVALSSAGANGVNVSSHWLSADGAPLLWDAPRVALPSTLLPGEQAVVSLPLATPPAGAAVLVADLVQEGIAWFGVGPSVPVTVTQ
jgi:hypothetical protein